MTKGAIRQWLNGIISILLIIYKDLKINTLEFTGNKEKMTLWNMLK